MTVVIERDRMTPPEVAALAKVSVKTVERWTKSGYLPQPVRIGRRRIEYPRDAVLAALSLRGTPVTQDAAQQQPAAATA